MPKRHSIKTHETHVSIRKTSRFFFFLKVSQVEERRMYPFLELLDYRK